MKTIFVIFLFAATTVMAQPQYFIATGDTTGYTVQNVFVDFTTLDQPQGVGRIALNSVICRGNSVLVRPRSVQTIQVSFPAARADSILSPTVTGSVSLGQALVQRIAQYAVRDSALGLPDSVTVKRLDGGTVTVIGRYGR